jgi:hypothetical protein
MTKKTAKKAVKKAPAKKAAAKRAAKATKKAAKRTKFTPRKLQLLLDTMLGQFAEQVAENGVKFSANEGLKIYQIRKELEPEGPREVHVEWVEPKEP